MIIHITPTNSSLHFKFSIKKQATVSSFTWKLRRCFWFERRLRFLQSPVWNHLLFISNTGSWSQLNVNKDLFKVFTISNTAKVSLYSHHQPAWFRKKWWTTSPLEALISANITIDTHFPRSVVHPNGQMKILVISLFMFHIHKRWRISNIFVQSWYPIITPKQKWSKSRKQL